MIKKLRWRFIFIAMFSMIIVLAVIIGSINVANFYNINVNLDERISLIMGNGGEFPQFDKKEPDTEESMVSSDAGHDGKGDTPPEPFASKHGMSEESQYDTRYFTVVLSEDGDAISTDTGNISAISEATAEAYAKSEYSAGKYNGMVKQYKFKGMYVTDDDGNTTIMYVFLNCERELFTFKNFLLASIGISLIGVLIVFILVYFFSKSVVRPMAESYEKQKRFITDASHEIKTPLTIIDANTEVLEMIDGENEWTISTRKQIRRLSALTEKLVFLARMDEDSARIEITEFNISEAVCDASEPFEIVAETHNKHLKLCIAPNIMCKGDEKMIRQLISLLLDNAIKYSNENGEIQVNLHRDGKDISLRVWNTVDEIKKGNLDELFERFYRTDRSHNSQTGGFGIGLSVAFSIVNAHKGKISAASSDGKSIEFNITL